MAVGLVPGLGNTAFPMQLFYSTAGTEQRLPQFVLFDTFAGLGRAIPIWGGRDSLLEARFNRLPHWLVRRLRSLRTRFVVWRTLKTSKGIS